MQGFVRSRIEAVSSAFNTAYQICQIGRGRLEPAPDVCSVRRVFLTEACFEIALLAGYDDERHHENRQEQSDQNPSIVDTERDSRLKQREREIDGVTTEMVRPDLDDSRSGLISGHRRTRRAECPDRPHEKRDRKNRDRRPEEPCQVRDESDRPGKMHY